MTISELKIKYLTYKGAEMNVLGLMKVPEDREVINRLALSYGDEELFISTRILRTGSRFSPYRGTRFVGLNEVTLS